MKCTLKWLKAYVDFDCSANALAERLTMAGLEVEAITTVDGETVLELEITPNRPDCLNIIGLAREVSAIFDRPLRMPKIPKGRPPQQKATIDILDREACRRYIGTLVRDVAVAAAPADLTVPLQAIGVRSINNIVDITNFCLMETGQPLHAFDYDKLEGGKIVVRRARPGETIVTIDGIERTLDDSVLVIADARRPVAIAGIMGGLETEVTAETTNILLESAWFDPVTIRRAVRKLGLASDSSYRFERGVDMDTVAAGADRALALIREHAGGRAAARSDVFPDRRKGQSRKITVSRKKIESLLGTAIPAARCKTILKKLGFTVQMEERQVLQVTPPPFRNDIRQDVDLIEEVARVTGYDRLPSSLPVIRVSRVPADAERAGRSALRRACIAQGFSEAVTYATTNQPALEACGLAELPGVKIQNPLSQDQEMLRPSMLPTLLGVVRKNMHYGQKDLRLFEIGKTYHIDGEQERLALVASGQSAPDWRQTKETIFSFFDLKGSVESVLSGVFGCRVECCSKKFAFLSIDASAEIIIEQTSAGHIGRVADDVLRRFGIKSGDIFYACLDLTVCRSHVRTQSAYLPPSEYPPVTRDISIAVPHDVPFARVKNVVHACGKGLVRHIQFLEEYCGKKIPPGQRGLVFSLTYQSLDRTLTDSNVQDVHETICRRLQEDCRATLR